MRRRSDISRIRMHPIKKLCQARRIRDESRRWIKLFKCNKWTRTVKNWLNFFFMRGVPLVKKKWPLWESDASRSWMFYESARTPLKFPDVSEPKLKLQPERDTLHLHSFDAVNKHVLLLYWRGVSAKKVVVTWKRRVSWIFYVSLSTICFGNSTHFFFSLIHTSCINFLMIS